MRVLILEDDHWIADLLKQIVLRLRPHAAIICLGSVAKVRALGINAFTGQPFQASRVAASLDQLLPAAAAENHPARAVSNAQTRLRRLAGLA
jgi:hypothetical protein